MTRAFARSQAFALWICEGLQRRYTKEQNPLYAWDAYQTARDAKAPIPEWVASYLDQCAKKLSTGVEPLAALGLRTRGGHSKAAQKESQGRDVGVFSRVDLLMDITPEDMGIAPQDTGNPQEEYYRRLLTKAKPARGAKSRAERIFAHVAWETKQRGHRYPGVKKALSAKTVAAIYYRLKKR